MIPIGKHRNWRFMLPMRKAIKRQAGTGSVRAKYRRGFIWRLLIMLSLFSTYSTLMAS
jgi:hypothetical protein